MAHKVPVQTSYPRGGVSEGSVFVDRTSGRPLRIHLDSTLPDHHELCKILTAHGGELATPGDQDAHLFILRPSNHQLIDSFCHPAWLPTRAKDRLIAAIERGEDCSRECWKQKVILSSAWIRQCHEECRFIGEEQLWGGMRQAGPPVDAQLFNLWEFGPNDTHYAPTAWTCADCDRQCLDRWDLEFHLSRSNCEPKAVPVAVQRPVAPRWRVMPEYSQEPDTPPAPAAIVLQPPTSPVAPEEDELMDDGDQPVVKPEQGTITLSQQSEGMDIDTPSSSQVQQQAGLPATRPSQLEADMDIETPTPTQTPQQGATPAARSVTRSPSPASTNDPRYDAKIDLSLLPTGPELSSMFPIFLGVNVWYFDVFSNDTKLAVTAAVEAVSGIVTAGDDWGPATHVLYPANYTSLMDDVHMDDLVQLLAAEGKWCISIDWVIQCLRTRSRLPEADFAIADHPREFGRTPPASPGPEVPKDKPRLADRLSQPTSTVIPFATGANSTPSGTKSATGANSVPVSQNRRQSATGANLTPVSRKGKEKATSTKSTPTQQQGTKRATGINKASTSKKGKQITGANTTPLAQIGTRCATGSNSQLANQTAATDALLAGAHKAKKERHRSRMLPSDYSPYGPWSAFHLCEIIGSERGRLASLEDPSQFLATRYGLSADEWKSLLEDWDKKAGLFSGFTYSPAKLIKRNSTRIPPVVIALVASHHHYKSGRTLQNDATQQLAQAHPEYTQAKWKRAMDHWRLRTGMFAKTWLSPKMTPSDEKELFSPRLSRRPEPAPNMSDQVEPVEEVDGGGPSAIGGGNASPSGSNCDSSSDFSWVPNTGASPSDITSNDNSAGSSSRSRARAAIVPSKRPRSNDGENVTAPKRQSVYSTFNASERQLMAAYMLSRLPAPTSYSPDDWADFAKTNHHRPAQSWAQHFRAAEAVIRSYLKKMMEDKAVTDAVTARAAAARAAVPVPAPAPTAPASEALPAPARVTRAQVASATPPAVASAPPRRSTRSTPQPPASTALAVTTTSAVPPPPTPVSKPSGSARSEPKERLKDKRAKRNDSAALDDIVGAEVDAMDQDEAVVTIDDLLDDSPPKPAVAPKPRATSSQPSSSQPPTPRRGRSAAEPIVIDDDDGAPRRRRTRATINNPEVIVID